MCVWFQADSGNKGRLWHEALQHKVERKSRTPPWDPLGLAVNLNPIQSKEDSGDFLSLCESPFLRLSVNDQYVNRKSAVFHGFAWPQTRIRACLYSVCVRTHHSFMVNWFHEHGVITNTVSVPFQWLLLITWMNRYFTGANTEVNKCMKVCKYIRK